MRLLHLTTVPFLFKFKDTTRLVFAKKLDKHCTIRSNGQDHAVFKLKQVLVLSLSQNEDSVEIDEAKKKLTSPTSKDSSTATPKVS